MHKTYEYQSVFSDYLNEYITAKRAAGFKYDNPAYWLYRFDQHCVNLSITTPVVTKTLYDDWSNKTDRETKTTQNNRIYALRGFSIYLNTLGIQSYVPVNLPRPEKVVPYLMSDSDIQELFDQIDSYKCVSNESSFKRMSYEYKILFRLIYCCGLRNNEACSIRATDFNLLDGSITLRNTKGNGNRVVYVSEDLRNLCNSYYHWLTKVLGNGKTEWFFPGKNLNQHIPKTSIDKKFNEFWNSTEASSNCYKKPTVHCLRHAFVIKRINLWMEKDISLQAMMPYLSNYLGHKSPIETYYYYHQVEEAFRTIRRKDAVSARVIPEVQYER